MTSDQGAIMRRNVLEVFAETDPARRLAVITEIYAEEAVFYDPEGEVSGHEAINALVTRLQAQDPSLRFRVLGEPRSLRDLATVDWELGPADGPAVMTGSDIALFEAGRIHTLYTLLHP